MNLIDVYKNFKEEVETEKEALELTLVEVKKWKYLVKAHQHTRHGFNINNRNCSCYATQDIGIQHIEDMGIGKQRYYDNEDYYLKELLEEQNIAFEEKEEGYLVDGKHYDSLFDAVEDIRRKNIALFTEYEKTLAEFKSLINKLKKLATISSFEIFVKDEVQKAKGFENAFEETEIAIFENACDDWTIRVYNTKELDVDDVEALLNNEQIWGK